MLMRNRMYAHYQLLFTVVLDLRNLVSTHKTSCVGLTESGTGVTRDQAVTH